MSKRAADHLVNQLVAQGTTHIFGVPGESYLPILDALHGREGAISFVTCRQEGGAAMAAEAHGKLTGRPGICMVTRGPGATNASAGVHVAYQDSTPMIVFIGQVARDMIDREAFQEIDYRRMFGQMAKWVAQIDDPSRIQEYVTRAYRTALSGRPGPVVLALPEDMLYDEITPPPEPRPITVPRSAPVPSEMAALQDRIQSAKRPLIIAGGGGWTAKGIQALQQFSEVQALPVSVSLRCQSLMDNTHPNYAGHFSVGPTPYLAEALSQTDLLIALGPRLGEMTTGGYKLLDVPVPKQDLVHVFPQGEELGRVYEPQQALVADMESFCCAAADWSPLKPATFEARTAQLHASYLDFANADLLPEDPLASYFAHMTEVLPHDAIMCNGAGNYAGWLHRFYKFRAPFSQLAPTSGSMGYGLPAAVGAAATRPDAEVFAIAGDGCLMMTCQEMATAAHHQLNLTVIVIDNARYGTIRAHQEREYPGRVSGTALTNPDFVAFAKSFGAKAERVHDLAAFKAALAKARSHKGVNLIDVPLGPEFLAPGKQLKS
ncbi:thiamine pyrophosphate-dependent enzyme [Algirhabdus cladophorae]|uniref:thiamine pyrophosphate-dependent enzyme n=1 Tax=Algirhabdus cladophorae TaxID=3377108 RepID=UPI003B846EAB